MPSSENFSSSNPSSSNSLPHSNVYLPNLLLDETSYPAWIYFMESFLGGLNLYGFVDGSIPCPPQFVRASDGATSVPNPEYLAWKVQDKSIVNMIGQTLSPVARNCAVGSKSSHDLWTRLKSKFADSNKQNILQLKANLQSVKKGSDDIETFLDRIKAEDALDTVGVSIDDEDVVLAVLNGLPSEYAAIKTVIRAQFTCSPLSQLKSLLKAAEMEINSESQSIQSLLTAMLANLNLSSQGSGSPSNEQNGIAQPSMPVSANNSAAVHSSVPSLSVQSSSQFVPSTPPGFSNIHNMASSSMPPAYPTSFTPSYPYIPTPAMPYSFQMSTYPIFPQPAPLTGMYAGRGMGRGNGNQGSFQGGRNNFGRGNFGNFGRGGGNTNGGRGNYGDASSSRTNGGAQLVCQLCNKTGHGARTCRTLPTFQDGNNVNVNQNQALKKCQYCEGVGHTADGCFFIIGFPGQQNQAEEHTAMLATTNLAPQFWLADTGATNHMTNNIQLLHNVTTYPATDAVQIGNGQGEGQDFIPGTE